MSLLPAEITSNSPKVTKVVAWIIGLITAFAISPFIFAAVKGIVGLALALGVGYTCLRFAPVVSAMISNAALKALKWEARRNPVETMMNIYLDRRAKVDDAKNKIRLFNGQVENYGQQVQDLKKKYPEEAARFQSHYETMVQLKNRKYVALQEAERQLVMYHDGIEKASAIWEMTKASDAISASAGLLSEKDAVQQIQSDEALKAVELSMAQSFADLDHALRTEGQVLLTNDHQEVFPGITKKTDNLIPVERIK